LVWKVPAVALREQTGTGYRRARADAPPRLHAARVWGACRPVV